MSQKIAKNPPLPVTCRKKPQPKTIERRGRAALVCSCSSIIYTTHHSSRQQHVFIVKATMFMPTYTTLAITALGFLNMTFNKPLHITVDRRPLSSLPPLQLTDYWFFAPPTRATSSSPFRPIAALLTCSSGEYFIDRVA
jgi:hypothetical protein